MMKLFQHGHGFGDHVELKQEFYLLASFGQEEGMQPFQQTDPINVGYIFASTGLSQSHLSRYNILVLA